MTWTCTDPVHRKEGDEMSTTCSECGAPKPDGLSEEEHADKPSAKGTE